MDGAVDRLEGAGIQDNCRLWQSDQPQPVKGKQRQWTRDILKKNRDHLLQNTFQRHAVAIRSSSSMEASRFLDCPSKPSDQMSDDAFQVSLRRRLALPPVVAGSPMLIQTHCQNINASGQKCNVILDAEGQHACTCEVG
eukprot:12297590-Karenia_brevis.AAC.1